MSHSLDDAAAPDDPEALELLAMDSYRNGEFEAAVDAWDALHSLQVERGDRPEAARAAAMLAMFLMMDTGLMAPVRGWLSTAERLLDGHDECPAHAVIAMTRTYERFMSGDMDGARQWSETAIELGERTGVTPAVVIGRTCNARVHIFDGEVERGLELLDDVGALLMSGTVDALTTGMMLCELICAAQGLAMYDRAAEWTTMMERWRHGAAFGGIHGRCRVHRAEMLRLTGTCAEAELEALGACDDLRPWMRREFGWPLTELGNIRLRAGDLAGAEEAYLAAHGHAWSPQPGLALLRLEQGDADAAAALIADALANPVAVPSKERPPFGDLGTAPLLAAQAEIGFARGDAETVRAAADALTVVADRYPSPSIRADARLADAWAALLDHDPAGAVDAAREAVGMWAEIGAPFETAKARLVLAEALDRAGNGDAAAMERTAAATTFASFGAVRWAERAAGTHVAAPPVDGAAPAEAVFRVEGDLRVVRFDDRETRLKDLKGFRYLERLLREPGREFHVLDLVAVEQGTLPTAGPVDHDTAAGMTLESGLPTLDDQARDAYRRRLAEVEADIAEAEADHDLGRLDRAQHDREFLLAELGRAVGLGGRLRSVGSDAERARTAVARSLRYALDRLAEHDPALADHLRRGLETGTYCRYIAEPTSPRTWHTD